MKAIICDCCGKAVELHDWKAKAIILGTYDHEEEISRDCQRYDLCEDCMDLFKDALKTGFFSQGSRRLVDMENREA